MTAYRPDIDGLRALAVLPVVAFHLKLGYLPVLGGFLGVDVFFVISGFLITSIITSEIRAGTFSLRKFWARRIRRIIPTLLVVVTATLLVARLFLWRVDHPRYGSAALASLTSLANFYSLHHARDYWGPAADQQPFLHTWSLSVEEQFYLVFPIVLGFIVRYGQRKLISILLSLMVMSFLLFHVWSRQSPQESFYLLPARMWELLVGACTAVLIRRWPPLASHRIGSWLGPLGLLMILGSYLLLPRLDTRAVIPVLGTALVLGFSAERAVGRLLAARPLVYIGKISYTLYMWHWPLLVMNLDLDLEWKKLPVLAVVVLLTIATYHGIERPIRRKPAIIPVLSALYLAAVCLASTMALSSGVYDTTGFDSGMESTVSYALNPPYRATDLPAPPDAFRKGGLITGPGSGDPAVVVLGDSHAGFWSPTIRRITDRLGLRASFWSLNGVTPFIQLPLRRPQNGGNLTPQEKYEYDQSRLESIRQWKPQVVIVCSRWSARTEAESIDLLGYLSENAGLVLIMEQPPELDCGEKNVLQYLCFKKIRQEEGTRRYLRGTGTEGGRNIVRQLEKRFPNVHVIPTYDLYAHGSDVLCLDGSKVVYLDDDHLTDYGARMAEERIERMIQKSLARRNPADTLMR